MKLEGQEGQEDIDKPTAIDIIGIWNTSGLIVANTNKELIGKKMPDHYLQDVKTKGSHFGGFENDPLTGENFLIFLQSIRDFEDNQFAGAIILKVKAHVLNEVTGNTAGLGETGEVLIGQRDIDNPTKIEFISDLRHTNNPPIVTIGSDDAIPVQEAVQGMDGEGVSVDYRGEEIFAVWKALPQLEWGMVTKFDKAEAFAPATKLRNWISVIALGTFILMFFLSLIIERFITSPIEELHSGMRIIEKGNLDHKVGYEGGGEIGKLARAFDVMTAAVKQSRADVDKKVEEQTRQLEIEKTEADKARKTAESMNEVMSGRELKMIELKKKITLLENNIIEKPDNNHQN